jgi:LysM repeat protein
MKVKSFIRILPAALIMILLSNNVCSQVVVERSHDKVVISGIPYYVHQVKKGETAYSISKAYGVTVEELTKENPPALYGIREGQALRIPVRPLPAIASAATEPVKRLHDETKFIYHNLKPGETVYFLSKTYGVSENEILQNNEGIDINKLSVGTEIVVPRREFRSVTQKFDSQEKKYTYHKVLQGESLSSIARDYGLTTRELRRENRDMRFPQVGDYIRVPQSQTAAADVIEPARTDTLPSVPEEPVLKPERPAGYTPVKSLRGSFNVAVLLPFYLSENAERTTIDSSSTNKGRKILKAINRNDDWIYPRSLDFIEMYEGILLAADTLVSLGLDINLYPYDIKSDTIETTRLIRSGKLADMDLIIGPVYSHNLNAVASYAKDLGIPVVSPVPLVNNSALSGNTTLFMAGSSFEIAQKMLASKVSEYYDKNFVFIHSDTLGNDDDVKRLKNLIFTDLGYHLPFEEIRFKELPYYSRSMFDNDSINRLSHALSDRSQNIIIIASEDKPVISETIVDIHNLSRKFDLKVFGYPVMRDIDNLDPKYLFDLDILVYSPNWIDYSRPDIQEFNADFRKKFLTEPPPKSYAWQGYDIAYYFLSGLALNGKDFIMNPGNHNPDLLETEFDFVRKQEGDGFENQKLFLVRYTKDYEVKLVEENTIPPQK